MVKCNICDSELFTVHQLRDVRTCASSLCVFCLLEPSSCEH